MTDVLFYDFDFNLIADVPRIISFNIEKHYCGFGTAELHFSLAAEDVIAMLENNPYVFFVAGTYFAVVTGWQIGEDIAVFGRTPEWLLTKRGIQPISHSDTAVGTIVCDAVSSAAGDFLAVGKNSFVGEAMDYSTDKVRVLYDVICEVLKTQNLGFKVTPDVDNKQFVFEVYSGAKVPALVSQSNRTAYDMTYTVEKQDMATQSGWYERKMLDMGNWNASTNSPKLSNNTKSNAYTYYKITVSYSSRFGLSCTAGNYLYCDTADGVWKTSEKLPQNIWVYYDNSTETGAKRWDAVLRGAKTEAEALAEFSDMKKAESLQTEVKRLVYGTDYALGDIVRVQLEFDAFKKAEKKRVDSVSIYYDVDKAGVTPILKSVEG